MKKILYAIFTISILMSFSAFSQEDITSETENAEVVKNETSIEETVEIENENEETDIENNASIITFDVERNNEILKKIAESPYVVFNEGVFFGQIYRYQSQDDYNRSDFRWVDYLIGPYIEVQSKNITPFNFMARLAIFYPFYKTFNEMQQISKQILVYGFDVFTGVLVNLDGLKYIRVNFGIGPHLTYELSDEFHHADFGGMILAGVELPIAWRWTLLVNAFAAIDYGNLGTNRVVMPYSFDWQYQVELGVRYNIKGPNMPSYLPSNKRLLASEGLYDKKQTKLLQKEIKRDEKREARKTKRESKQFEDDKKAIEKANLREMRREEKKAEIIQKELEKREAKALKEAEKEAKKNKGKEPDEFLNVEEAPLEEETPLEEEPLDETPPTEELPVEKNAEVEAEREVEKIGKTSPSQ